MRLGGLPALEVRDRYGEAIVMLGRVAENPTAQEISRP
jgi:hypothetical protein